MTVTEIQLDAPSPLILTALARTAGVAAGVSADHKVRIWNTRSRVVTHTIDVAGREPAFMAISEDGRLLMFADYAFRLTVWNTTTARVEWSRRTPRYLTAATFSRDIQLVAIAPGPLVQMYDARTHEIIRIVETTAGTSAVAFSRDGLSLAAADANGVRVYDVRSGRLWTKSDDFVSEPLAVEFLLDDRTVFAGGGDQVVLLIDARTGKTLRRSDKLSDPVFYIEASPNARTVAVVTLNADDPAKPTPVVFCDAASLMQTSNWEPPAGVLLPGTTWASDGSFLAATQSPSKLHVWSISL